MTVTRKSAKSRVLAVLTKTTGRNTLSVAQARKRFGIYNVSARVSQLRQEGYNIRNVRRGGSRVYVLHVPFGAN